MHRRRIGFSGWRAHCLAALLAVSALQTASADPEAPERHDSLNLTLRSRVETARESGRYRTVESAAAWDPRKTAIIVCDMWDSHHCLNAVRRVQELAPRMDQVIQAARQRGVTVIHAPSGCMETYRDHSARKRARATPRSRNLPPEIGQWCRQVPAEEKGTYPIDQAQGGEDDDPAEHAEWAAKLAAMGRNPKAPWKAQIDRLTIDGDRDLISDSGEEIWSILEDRRVDNVILLGVHTNMCVLGRPFGLRQMARNGKNVVLMRDMTDTMYDPRRAPYVSHFTGTDLIVEHIETYVCPTITSDQILGGKPFRFRGDTRPHVVLVIADDEYKTEITLPVFAARRLGRDFRVSTVLGVDGDLPGLEALDDADLAVISVRRRILPHDRLDVLRRFVAAGKPVIGIRTASHAFSPRPKETIPDGHDAWLTFDADVLGGNYHGHHRAGSKVTIASAPDASLHPILSNVDLSKLVGQGSLYQVSPISRAAMPLLIGSITGQSPEPVAWTHIGPSAGRVFYTSLGHPDDFGLADFNRLLRNAAYWAVGLEVPADLAARD